MDDLHSIDNKHHSAQDSGAQIEVNAVGHASRTANIPATPIKPTSTTSIVSPLLDRALDFLAHASNETLLACLAGLSATTYLVLGRIGLFIIGIAGGVVLQATWEGLRTDTRDDSARLVEQARRREAGIEIAKRLLDFRTQASTTARSEDVKVYATQTLDYSEYGAETETALNFFTDAIIKDYVHYWYDPTIPGEETFPTACRRTLVAFFLSLGGHLSRKRPADTFLDFVTNASSIVIVFLTELAAALNASPNSSAEEAISTYIQSKPDSSLSYMLDQDAQTAKLADVSEEILQAYLDPKSYNCPPIHAFLKEVLAQLVLGSTVTLCSRPDWINDWIVYGLEESKTTEKVMGIVDAGVEGKTLPTASVSNVVEDTDQPAQQAVKNDDGAPTVKSDHKRARSRAETSMDEAMAEARRLTELMIAEDERFAREEKEREERERQEAVNGSDVTSDTATHGIPTPTSSQGDIDNQDEVEGTDMSSPKVEAQASAPQFTSFDQIVPSGQPTALSEISLPKSSDEEEKNKRESATLTLHNAAISIFDDSVPGERASIKAKPTIDYLIQIEPTDSTFSGWMIARKYADFETLHEILRRISVITGTNFTHTDLPKWRSNTKVNLRSELETYLCDAMRLQPLAESEGMKRFLDKDRGLTKAGPGKGLGFPTPEAFGKLGGDMLNVLTKAPKQVAGGGKAVFGGVAGLVTGGLKSNNSQSSIPRVNTAASLDKSAGSSVQEKRASFGGPLQADGTAARDSQDSLRAPPIKTLERRGSGATLASEDSRVVSPATPGRPRMEGSLIMPATPSESSPSSSVAQLSTIDHAMESEIMLPPPPSMMPEDYASPSAVSKKAHVPEITPVVESNGSPVKNAQAPKPTATPRKAKAAPSSERVDKPLTEREAAVAVELVFAVITQLYTLSSAWNIRRTLLSAAKTFLLRPGNPQLVGIRDLLQKSLLDDNLDDAGIAHQIYKLRENSLPTAKEMEVWNRDFPPKSEEQKADIRVKARRLLVSQGMPQALMSVMGAAASGEALGKVFDSLQVERVSRGLIFGLMLQALRIVTH